MNLSGELRKELQRYYHRVEIPKVRKLIEELKTEYPEDWKIERRREYLESQKTKLKKEIDDIYRAYEGLKKEDAPYVERALKTMRLEKIQKEYKRVSFQLRSLSKGFKENAKGIKDDMIQIAKQYPFENLIEVKRGMALCPFHDDRNPSMGVKNNRYLCFACGVKGDVINFVMKRDGLTFPQAVNYLTAGGIKC